MAASSVEELDDVALVRLLSDGVDAALSELYRRYGPACYRMARQVTGNEAFAEDCVQETFLALWREPGRFDAATGGLGGWLLGLAHHKAVDLVRREASQQRRGVAEAARKALNDEPAGFDPAEAAWLRVRADSVRSVLATLPEAQREALGLAYYGGYTQREIAGLTGVPLGTVKTRMMVGMRRLRDGLAPLTSDLGGLT
jgi:RNA polymerase sigma factor (sigma-70 family)